MLKRHISKLKIIRNWLEIIVNILPANTVPPTVAYKTNYMYRSTHTPEERTEAFGPNLFLEASLSMSSAPKTFVQKYKNQKYKSWNGSYASLEATLSSGRGSGGRSQNLCLPSPVQLIFAQLPSDQFFINPPPILSLIHLLHLVWDSSSMQLPFGQKMSEKNKTCAQRLHPLGCTA